MDLKGESMEKREKKFLIAGIIFSVIMIVFSYTAITSKNGEQAEISKGSVQYQETKSAPTWPSMA